MKKQSSLLKHLIVFSAFLLPLNLMAQNDVGGLFKSAPADATKLVDAYMSPLFKGIGIGLNSGWHNTAKTKSFLRFDLRFTGTLATVPSEDKSYNTNTLGLATIKPAQGSNGIGSTFVGAETPGAKMEIYANGNPTGETFNLPAGTKEWNTVPSAQIQATIGLPKNIDITLRYLPTINLGSDVGEINIYGAGAKIEVLPLIMGKKDKLIPFDVAVAFGFTKTNYDLDLDVNNGKYKDQKLEVSLNGFNTEAIISKKILFFTPFASVGYVSTKSSLNALGSYDFQTAGGTAKFTNPVSISHNDISAMKASLGFQLNLAFLRVYGSYTQSKYSYFNGGIGFGIGK